MGLEVFYRQFMNMRPRSWDGDMHLCEPGTFGIAFTFLFSFLMKQGKSLLEELFCQRQFGNFWKQLTCKNARRCFLSYQKLFSQEMENAQNLGDYSSRRCIISVVI